MSRPPGRVPWPEVRRGRDLRWSVLAWPGRPTRIPPSGRGRRRLPARRRGPDREPRRRPRPRGAVSHGGDHWPIRRQCKYRITWCNVLPSVCTGGVPERGVGSPVGCPGAGGVSERRRSGRVGGGCSGWFRGARMASSGSGGRDPRAGFGRFRRVFAGGVVGSSSVRHRGVIQAGRRRSTMPELRNILRFVEGDDGQDHCD